MLVVIDARTEFRAVHTGVSDGQFVLIDKGVAVGEHVVAKADGVKANTRVQALDVASR